MSGAGEFYALAGELNAAGALLLPAVATAMTAGCEATKAAWVSGATASSGRHGVHYPRSIDYKVSTLGTLVRGEIGPESGPQSQMSFEFGSRNQPPHLDGLKAQQANAAPLGALLAKAAEGIIP